MARCIPDRNWMIVTKAINDHREPTDPFLAKVCEVRTNIQKDEKIAEALQYIDDDYYKDILVAFFLSGMERAAIAKFLRMDLEVLTYFERLVINPKEFRNKLDIFWYAEKYAGDCMDAKGRQVVQAGIQLGPFGLLHQFTHGDEEIEIDAKKISKKMIQVAFTLSQVARGNPVTSDQTKEAFKWMNSASKMAKEAERIGADTTQEDEALLAVEERKLARTAKDAGIEIDQILH